MTIGKGVFTRRVEEGTPGAVASTLKKGPNEGKLVHELHCNAIEGALVSFHIDESPWGKQWKITLDITTGEDGVEEFVVISTGYDNSHAVMLLKRLENLDLSKDVLVRTGAGKDKETGRDFSYTTFYQDGVKVAPAYTKEEPNGLPEFKKLVVNGQTVYDKTEMMAFLEGVALKKFSKATEAEEGDFPF